MTKYKLTVQRTVVEVATKTVEANSLDEAVEKVEEIDEDKFAWRAVDICWDGVIDNE